jgi:hypothetical protein
LALTERPPCGERHDRPEAYELRLDGSGIFPVEATTEVRIRLAFSDEHEPFADTWMILIEHARGMPFFQNCT